MGKDYDEREIQEDLNKLLLKVQRELKKKMFYRKHRKLLHNAVEICLGSSEGSYAGSYETLENKKYKHRFKHKIIINPFLYYEYKNGSFGLGTRKRYCKERLMGIIAHELIHAYVYENYEWCGKYGFHRDGSPIFLSILTFLNISSGHKSMLAFKHSLTYKKVKCFNNFKELEIYLIHLQCEYEKVFRELEEIIDNRKIYVNSFQFSSGNIAGLKGVSTETFIYQGILSKCSMFILGANTDVSRLRYLTLSKIDRNIFKNKHVMLRCKNIEDKKNKLALQSMNV